MEIKLNKIQVGILPEQVSLQHVMHRRKPVYIYTALKIRLFLRRQ